MPEWALALLARGLQDQQGDHFLILYLYGSAAMGDFRPGWSDLGLLRMTRSSLSPAQADALRKAPSTGKIPSRRSLRSAPERCMMVQSGNERRFARCCRTLPFRNPSGSG